ncbi:uncharacterized protein EV154DRAFT_453225 [Mucor mucedo]|uniref:uncharacterized protein n=1 Tax=Mucor mucedo TaxID=29922 RepID=UPI00221EFFB6|nr:uncharacterized protein EV154DRAFT_453225 [Mucor mucedo]KAI7870088.1 hypothetical protein EV154DRAFT_453225 [Mucor mucedo]
MSNNTMNRTALIFGATGAVGKQVLKSVLKDGTYTKVITVGRRSVELEDSVPQDKLVQKTIDFENLDAHRQDFKDVNDVYCCLGTTRGAAGSAEKFIKFDQQYVLDSAKIIAQENKVDENKLAPVHYLYCSTMGSNKDSVFLYPKTKGQTEEALGEAGFEKVSIFHPAFLEPVEPRKPFRLVETVAFAIYNPINRLFGLSYVTSVDTVGVAMHKVAENASIKPTDPKNIKKSTIGSLVSHFTNSEIHTIGGAPK